MDSDRMDNTGAGSGQELVQYGAEQCAQVAQFIPPGGLQLAPYVQQPVIYKVYNISNPVGIQIESQESSMSVDDPRRSPDDKQPDFREMGTQTGWSSENDNEVGKRYSKNEGVKEAPPFTVLKPVPKQISCKRVETVSRRIISTMEILQEEGKWHNYDRFYRRACSDFAEDPDILIRIVLENSNAAYYRNDLTAGQQSILRVQELIFQTQDPVHHQAHMLYLKSALFRKEKKYREAENAIVLARQGLKQMQVGRDTGEIWYNVAALYAQVLNDEYTEIPTSEFRAQATEAFQSAIAHYIKGGEEDESCRNKLRRAHIRYAMSLLGCWSEVRPSNPGDDVTEDDLRQAGDSLDEVERSLWDGIPNRMRYYWHLARSDLFRYKNRMQRALEMAEEALKIAQASTFPSEVQFAKGRVKLLSKLVSDQRSLSNKRDSKSDPILEEIFGDEDTILTCNKNKNKNIFLVLIGVAVSVFVAVCVQYLLHYHHR